MISGDQVNTKAGPTDDQGSDAKANIESALKVIAAGIGLAYGTGFLVALTFLNEYGIREAGGEFFKLRYIYIGTLCLTCPVSIVCILQGLFSGQQPSSTIIPASSLKHLLARLFTPSENMPIALILMLINLSAVFYCILAFAHPGLFRENQSLINWLYVPVLATLVLRLLFGEYTLWSQRLNLIRWVLVLIGFVPTFLILKNIDFASMFRERLHNYLILQLLFFFFVYRFTKWPLLGSSKKDRMSRLLVRSAILGSLFILGIFSFAHTVYNHIPAEKGGGDFTQSPDAQICFSDVQRTSIPVGLIESFDRQPICTVPVKIIEETSGEAYVARSSDRGSHSEKEAPNSAALWRSGTYYPVVFEVSRSTISSIVTFNQGKVQLSIPVPTSPVTRAVPQKNEDKAAPPKTGPK
jgi:hypothetical protein